MRHLRNDNGMTLMELMIVVVVIGITTSLAAPSFFEILPQLRAKAEVRDIAFSLRDARSKAVATKQPHGVSFDYNANAFTVFAVDSTGDSTISLSEIGNDVLICYDTFGSSDVVFQPDGSASESGYVCISTDDYRGYFWVSVIAATGRVKVEKSWDIYY